MNKSISWKKNKIISKLTKMQNKYGFDIQIVDNLSANGCVIKFDTKYIIFINKNIPENILPLVIFHEIGHIKFNTISKNPKKYSYFNETMANFYAIYNLLFMFKLKEKIKIIYFTFKSENKLYHLFKKINTIGGKFLYEEIVKN